MLAPARGDKAGRWYTVHHAPCTVHHAPFTVHRAPCNAGDTCASSSWVLGASLKLSLTGPVFRLDAKSLTYWNLPLCASCISCAADSSDATFVPNCGACLIASAADFAAFVRAASPASVPFKRGVQTSLLTGKDPRRQATRSMCLGPPRKHEVCCRQLTPLLKAVWRTRVEDGDLRAPTRRFL